MLNHRTTLAAKTGVVAAKETKAGYSKGCYLKRQPCFLDGLVIGTKKVIQAWRNTFRISGLYKRHARPHQLAVGNLYSIRAQRGHAMKYR